MTPSVRTYKGAIGKSCEGSTKLCPRGSNESGFSTSITIPESVTELSVNTLKGCNALKELTLGKGLRKIAAGTFAECTGLEKITIHATRPPTTDGYIFSNATYENATLYVPQGSVSKYQVMTGWSGFYNISEMEGLEPDFHLTLSQSTATLAEGESLILTATIVPSNASDASVIWSSSNEEVAIVSSKGKVVAIGAGTATITATTNDGSGVSASCEVTVMKKVISVTSIELNRISATLTEGESLTLTATVSPNDATDKSVAWSSSNSKVATVDNTGKVTAKSVGTTIITVTANDGSGVSASCEVTVSSASYVITFLVDGEVYATKTLKPGATITVPEEPTKEGHTFSGWSGLPETMPAKDITVSGTFTVNKYLVTFTIDGVVIASDSLEYGAPIVPPTMPEREGYTFSGWGDVAETVPASDVTYNASYTANLYNVYYFVGATLVHTVKVAYGEPIPEYIYEPEEEGYTFLGWVGETYATMPAHDVTYTANIDDGIGQLIMGSGQLTIYDLTGRKVTDTENIKGGIYIVNGKKVVIND